MADSEPRGRPVTTSLTERIVVVNTTTGGYSGPATIQITAADGFNRSDPIPLAIDVSAAELLDIEIVNRQPQMNAGDGATLRCSVTSPTRKTCR